MTQITIEQIKSEAKSLVEAFGPCHENPGVSEFGCSYTDVDGCHCIAGQIGVNLGIEIPAHGDDDNEQNVDGVDAFIYSLTPDALVWLSAVQNRADEGATWAEAVRFDYAII